MNLLPCVPVLLAVEAAFQAISAWLSTEKVAVVPLQKFNYNLFGIAYRGALTYNSFDTSLDYNIASAVTMRLERNTLNKRLNLPGDLPGLHLFRLKSK